MSKKETGEAPKEQTGIICPHCKEFIPQPVQSTLKLKITWYLDGKDPKKGAKPVKVARYPVPPKVGGTMTFKDSVYQITRIENTHAGEAFGFVKLVTKGDYSPAKTQIQDHPETEDE